MRHPERTDDGGAGKVATAAQGGFATVIGAIGRAFGFLGRVGRRDSAGKGTTDISAHPQRRRIREDSDLERGIAQLEMEIVHLEAALDQVYTNVVRGADSVKRDEYDEREQALPPLLERARELKEELREKRGELLRCKRDAARQSRLNETAAIESKTVAQGGPPRATTGPLLIQDSAGNSRMHRTIAKVAPSISFSDSSQKVIFEKVFHDLLDDDGDIRRAAAARIGESGGPEMFDILLVALEDRDNKVRVAALNSLALVGDRSMAQVFVKYAGNADHHLRLAALRGLARVGDESTNQVFFAGLEDDHASVRKAAATYLGWRREKAATKMLVSMLHDDDEDVRCAVATALGSVRDDRAVLSLIRALADTALVVRGKAKKALSDTLGEEIDADIGADEEALKQRIEELREWWKKARIDKHFQRRGGLPITDGHEEIQPAEGRQAGEPPAEPVYRASPPVVAEAAELPVAAVIGQEPPAEEGPMKVAEAKRTPALRSQEAAAARVLARAQAARAANAAVDVAPDLAKATSETAAGTDVAANEVAIADRSAAVFQEITDAQAPADSGVSAIDGLASLGLEGLDLNIGGAEVNSTGDADEKFESLLGPDLALGNIVTDTDEKK